MRPQKLYAIEFAEASEVSSRKVSNVEKIFPPDVKCFICGSGDPKKDGAAWKDSYVLASHILGKQCRDAMEWKWTADDPETINLRHKLDYPRQSDIDRIRFDLGFQAFVLRGEGKSGFSFFRQLSDINATLVSKNLEMMSSGSFALIEDNRATGENAALNNSAIYTARLQARRSRSAEARSSRSAADAGENGSKC